MHPSTGSLPAPRRGDAANPWRVWPDAWPSSAAAGECGRIRGRRRPPPMSVARSAPPSVSTIRSWGTKTGHASTLASGHTRRGHARFWPRSPGPRSLLATLAAVTPPTSGERGQDPRPCCGRPPRWPRWRLRAASGPEGECSSRAMIGASRASRAGRAGRADASAGGVCASGRRPRRPASAGVTTCRHPLGRAPACVPRWSRGPARAVRRCLRRRGSARAAPGRRPPPGPPGRPGPRAGPRR